jgi:quercetin dioxygenase-like cupin family protein
VERAKRRKQVKTSQPIFRTPDEGRVLEVGGDLFTFKGTQEDGIGSLFLELVCPPGGGPPPHTDPSEELFYVLEGEFEFIYPGPDEPTTHRASTGDSLIVPKRAPHTYRNAGSDNGRLLVFFRDNEHMQPFFEDLGDFVSDPANWTSSGPPPIERAMEAALRHGIEAVRPGTADSVASD